MSGVLSKTANSFDESSPQTSRSDDKSCWCSFVKIQQKYVLLSYFSKVDACKNPPLLLLYYITFLLKCNSSSYSGCSDMSEQRPKHQTMRLLTHHLHYVKFKKSKPSYQTGKPTPPPLPTVFTHRLLPSWTGTSCCIAAS